MADLSGFGRGVKRGLQPGINELMRRGAAGSDLDRRLDLLSEMSNLDFQKKQRLDTYEYNKRLNQAIVSLREAGLGERSEQLAPALASGIDVTKMGVELPLGERAQELFDLELRGKKAKAGIELPLGERAQELFDLDVRGREVGIEATQARALQSKAAAARGATGKKTDTLLKMVQMLESAGREIQTVDTGRVDAFGNPVMQNIAVPTPGIGYKQLLKQLFELEGFEVPKELSPAEPEKGVDALESYIDAARIAGTKGDVTKVPRKKAQDQIMNLMKMSRAGDAKAIRILDEFKARARRGDQKAISFFDFLEKMIQG